MVESDRAREVYSGIIKRKLIFLYSLIPLLFFIIIVSVSIGTASISVPEVLSAIFKKFLPSYFDCSEMHYLIVWELRMPVILMGVLVGIGLGVAGTAMQTILNNPLASPYTLGLSGGAGFGAALAIAFGIGIPYVGHSFFIATNAFFFSLLVCFLIYLISKLKGASSATMVLTGIALMYLFSSLVSLIQYFVSEEVLQEIVFWLFGSLSKATWENVFIVFAVVLVVCPLVGMNAWKLTALRLGDKSAEGLGIDVKKLRLKVMVYISLLTAVAVCFTGVIGFIGLVSPHMARMMVGEDHRYLLPASCLMGAILLTSSNTVGRIIIAPFILPVGITTSFIGVPFFLYLILSKRREFW